MIDGLEWTEQVGGSWITKKIMATTIAVSFYDAYEGMLEGEDCDIFSELAHEEFEFEGEVISVGDPVNDGPGRTIVLIEVSAV